jgi:glutathione S-transferase
MIVCEYLDSLYPENKLIPTDSYVKARQQIILDAFSRVTSAYYKIVRTANPDSLNDLNKSLDYFEKSLTSNYFGGENPTLVDYCMWPWFERFSFLKLLVEYKFDKKKFPKLAGWMDRMKKLPEVIETAINTDELNEFHKSFVAGHPDYDVGL